MTHHQGCAGYNHATFDDLVLSGVVGLIPSANGSLVVNPLVPADALPWWAADGMVLHGRVVSVLFDADGKKYGKGAGLQVLVDGAKVAAAARLEKLTVQLKKPAEPAPTVAKSDDDSGKRIDWYGPLNYGTAARTLFLRPYLALLPRFFAVFSVLTPGFQKVAPKDRGPVPQRSKTAEERVVADLFSVDRYCPPWTTPWRSVSHHDTAGILVAFFSRCQRYRLPTGLSDPERLVVGGWSCAPLF